MRKYNNIYCNHRIRDRELEAIRVFHGEFFFSRFNSVASGAGACNWLLVDFRLSLPDPFTNLEMHSSANKYKLKKKKKKKKQLSGRTSEVGRS